MPYSPRYGFIEDIGEKTDNRCHICHDEAHPDHYGSPGGPLKGLTTTVDHIVPQSHGGDDHPDNLLLAHAACNSSRGTRPAEEARLQYAGTTDKPFSSGEVQLIVQYRQELELREARQRAGVVIAVGLAIAAGVVWLGSTLWKLYRQEKAKASQSPRRPAILVTAAKPPQIEPQAREAAVIPQELERQPSEQATLVLGWLEQRQLSSPPGPSTAGLSSPSTGQDAGRDDVCFPELGQVATATPVSGVVE
jgi:hypothetical protein